MGVDTHRSPKRPPLPAPTDTSTSGWETGPGAQETDLETDLSRRTDRTDKTSYSIPEDGSPVTITTKKRRDSDAKGSHNSQTSLLIEYFEASKTEGKETRRPSVRVRVTPSGRKSKRDGTSGDHVQITQTDRNRTPSYTRRISLNNKSDKVLEASEISNSDRSNLSTIPPVEVEFIEQSDISRSDISRGPAFIAGSDISSMPPDSMLEGSGEPAFRSPKKSQAIREEERIEETVPVPVDTLKAPTRSRSLSRERLTQKAVEKIMSQQRGERGAASSTKVKGVERRSSRDADAKGALLGSELSHKSDRSGTSAISGTSSINNPKLLATVEDAIRRLILPEITTLREEQARYKKAYLRDSITSTGTGSSYATDGRRRVSKVSSEPRIRSGSYDHDVPSVFTDDHGEMVEGGRRRHRRSSKDSSSTVREEERAHVHRKSSGEKSGGRARDVAAGALAGAAATALTAAALKKHDSSGNLDRRERRKRKGSTSKSGSRSRRESVSESYEETRREAGPIPPMPMQSELVSDVTRDSIRSIPTDVTAGPLDRGSFTPKGKTRSKSSLKEREIMEVSRGSPRHITSPTTRTPTRTPVSLKHGLGTYHDNLSPVETVRSARSEKDVVSSGKPTQASAGAGMAITPAAMAAAAAIARLKPGEFDDVSEEAFDGATAQTPSRSVVSPIQSVDSYRDENDLTMAGALGSPDSMSRSGTTRPYRPHGFSMERSHEVMGQFTPSPSRIRAAGTPGKDSPIEPGGIEREAEEFFRRAHEENDRYRNEMSTEPVTFGPESLDDYETRRLTRITENTEDDWTADQQNLREVGQTTEYVRTPLAVESAVASLLDPSTLSVRSSQGSHLDAPHSQAGSATLDRGLAQDVDSPRNLQHETSGERWGAIRDQARSLKEENSIDRVHHTPTSKQSRETPLLQMESPTQTASIRAVSRELQREPSVTMSARGIPGQDEPAIGFIPDDESDIITNPTEIQGAKRLSGSDKLGFDKRAALAAAAAGAVMEIGARGLSRGKNSGEHVDPIGKEVDARGYMQPTVDDEYNEDPGYDPVHEAAEPGQKAELSRNIPMANNDEGYQTDTHMKAQPFAREDEDMDDEYPDVQSRAKYLSGMSAGMESPLYDSATGRGIDRIKSKDVVALMDHLTVRDAQRNARDTEILVTLVRSAAEMRTQWEEMKRFIREQDGMVMSNADRNADITVQRVLGGPRPQPLGSPRAPRGASSEETDEMSKKRENVFRRALKGLSMKGNSDLTKIEDMLMQLLSEVEGLKLTQGMSANMTVASRTQPASVNSYEHLRTADPGYEPEGRAGTNSSPNQSGYFSNPSSRHVNGLHSGYDGRGGSEGHARGNRISTVLEGDEDEQDYDVRAPLTSHPYTSAKAQAAADQRLLTPTQEAYRNKAKARAPSAEMEKHLTPPRQTAGQFQQGSSTENTPARTSEKKHKSTSSSLFGIPRMSRWSKTTASTAAPDSTGLQGSTGPRQRPFSDASRSGSNLDVTQYDDGTYAVHDEDRLRSTNSLAHEGQAQLSPVVQASATYMPTAAGDIDMPHGIPRSPSPLIPETASGRSKASVISQEDPKYQAHRNSLNLQHPQPRQGQTGRHQNHLEGVATSFDPKDFGLGSDLSGVSNTTSGIAQPQDQWGSEPALALNRQRFSGSSGGSYRDDGPLVPAPATQTGASRSSYAERAQAQAQAQSPTKPRKAAVDAREHLTDEEDHSTDDESDARYVGPTLTSMPPAPPNTLAGYQAAPPLAPIQEVPSVRYSLDEGSLRDMREELTPSPSLRNQPRMQTPTRKITGPRPMPGAAPRNGSGMREMMSKKSFDSLESYRDSVDSETF
ncbi:hypothetical protein P152DRAFT_451732 [Eremomyces bilateralis CBS 781.70]|uniref:Uncharacterized protein n=1 Tax=Eremomyces bilateralis CBS 781.70 TaxID=1392243 RepID=A0A6G1FVH1_9PEZI|nr:uncharacterized protein P152DRAFT_451732 [Eremomyces bilateralis CBS 781.70]KAF1809784.1 hypothetical protein P152DRAFT_451732 [Eremomyces bilateralis CBS 781.70]